MDVTPGTSKKIRYGDADFEKIAMHWLDEIEAGDDNDDLDSDAEYVESEHDSESEIDVSESENAFQISNEEQIPEEEVNNSATTNTGETTFAKSIYGKNRYKWFINPTISKNTRTLKHNIILKLPGLRGSLAQEKTSRPLDDWELLFTEEMLQNIVRWTNVKIRIHREKYSNTKTSDLRDVDITELRGFLGLLLYTSIFKSNHESIRSIFATDGTGRDIFRCITNANRFGVLLTCLSLDNPEDRKERRKEDPLANISEFFNAFITNCQKVFTIGSVACIDEMLVAFRGRCKFKMYIPNKPAKYGIKLMVLADARSGYCFNAYIYHGKDSDGCTLTDDEKKYSKPSQAVIRLSKPIQGSNMNITADNWFSSIEIVNYLFKKNLTYVGTLKKNKREIPITFLPSKSKVVGSSSYAFTKEITLVSYVPKKNKAVILVSSMHHSECTDMDTNKPEIITFYNSTKGGVDSLDEKCSVYSTGRRTRRWPIAIFYRLLDISSVNSYILYQSHRDNLPITRFEFVKKLAFQLVTPILQLRMTNYYIGRDIRTCITRILGEPDQPEINPEEQLGGKLSKRKLCSMCSYKKSRKTSYYCIMCKQPICLQCSDNICKDCSK